MRIFTEALPQAVTVAEVMRMECEIEWYHGVCSIFVSNEMKILFFYFEISNQEEKHVRTLQSQGHREEMAENLG